jgi:hypothetical protein
MTSPSPLRSLWIALAIAAVLGAAYGYTEVQAPSTAGYVLGALQQISIIAAMAIALRLCLRIQADYRPGTTMRLAWRLIAASVAVAILRHAVEFAGRLLHPDPDLLSLRQIPIALALVLLTFGLIAMWSSFAALGLGFRFRLFDLIGVVAIVACLPFVFSLREAMGDSRSAYGFIRAIQSASPLLLAAPALVGLMLHRMSFEMGQGSLALSLRLMVASLLVRLLALWLGTSPWTSRTVAGQMSGRALFWASAWIFAIGVFHRWNITVTANTLTGRYTADPQREIAELCQGAFR